MTPQDKTSLPQFSQDRIDALVRGDKGALNETYEWLFDQFDRLVRHLQRLSVLVYREDAEDIAVDFIDRKIKVFLYRCKHCPANAEASRFNALFYKSLDNYAIDFIRKMCAPTKGGKTITVSMSAPDHSSDSDGQTIGDRIDNRIGLSGELRSLGEVIDSICRLDHEQFLEDFTKFLHDFTHGDVFTGWMISKLFLHEYDAQEIIAKAASEFPGKILTAKSVYELKSKKRKQLCQSSKLRQLLANYL